ERPAEDDLEWIEAQGQRIIAQAEFPDASGVALFAGGEGLREVLPLRVAFEDVFVVNGRPCLRPLVDPSENAVPALVVFVDGTGARLVALTPAGPGEEVALEHSVEGRHKSGGWAALAQTRYQRHIEAHRDQHFQATAAAVAMLAERHDVRRIVLSGEPRAVAVFREHLPTSTQRLVAGAVSGARYESTAAIVTRAAERLARLDEQGDAGDVDRLLDAAAKGGRAVAGVEPTLEAVNRNAVQHLYMVRTFERAGAVCGGCGALQPPAPGRCRFCGGGVEQAELGEAMVGRVLASGGEVSVVERHAGLAGRDGVGAILRYAA
ncbi:MAG TPA: Vms1/Ankzf1 family peptidyl-tRNA hydrolase, partial [Methylomirabilota bacterium]|nr:Vms1/Ankzf1 family peptidyl-tRNA hydrolase [Methylomirabilota bacterium]